MNHVQRLLLVKLAHSFIDGPGKSSKRIEGVKDSMETVSLLQKEVVLVRVFVTPDQTG